MLLLMFLLESVEVGWLGGAGVGGASIITAVIVLWKRSEATNAKLIEAHEQRANEAEGRTKEALVVLHKANEALEQHTRTIGKHAEAIKLHADSEIKMADATKALADANKSLAQQSADIVKSVEKLAERIKG